MMGEVRPDVMDLMGKSAGWLRFLSILGFLFGAFTLVMALAFGSLIRQLVPELSNFGFIVSALLVGLAIVYIVCGIRMWAYASAIRRMQAGQMLQDLESVMERQASLWITIAALIGVMILIAVGFSVFLIASISSDVSSAG